MSDRLSQTKESIVSIKKKCPKASIILIEGGIQNPEKEFIDLVDKFIYLGDVSKVRKAVDSQNRGSGEAEMILGVMDNIKRERYKFLFKLSGRYLLNDEFTLDNYDFTRFNFKNYVNGTAEPYGESYYIKGSHSTRLYGVPREYYTDWENALIKCRKKMKKGMSIEFALPFYIKGDKFFYQRRLGVSGNIGCSGENIKE